MSTYTLQPHDSDLDAIAALATTSFGRNLLAAANAGALYALIASGTPSSSTFLRGDGTWAGIPAIASAVDSVNGHTGAVSLTASDLSAQPVDSDLTAIAALATTSFGRSFLTLANAAAARTLLGLGSAATSATTDFDAAGTATSAAATAQAAAIAASQPLDSDLTAIAALSTSSFGRAFLTLADAAAGRTAIDAQQSNAILTALAGVTGAADKGVYFTGASAVSTYDLTSAARTLLSQSTTSAMRNYLSLVKGTDVVAAGGTNTVTAMGLITPNGADVSGLVIKSPDSSWGANGETTPIGDALYATGQFITGFKEGGSTTSDSMLFRIDRTGGWGSGGAMHLNTGLNQRLGYAPTQCLWVNPKLNTNGIVITAPTVSDSASWDHWPIIFNSDRSGTARNLFWVDQSGLVNAPNSNSGATRYRLLEHFVGADAQATNGSRIGASFASALLNGTGAQITTSAGFAANGVATMETGTTTTGRGGVYLPGNPISFAAASTDVVFGARVYITTLSTVSEQHEVRVGLNVSFGATAPANGLYLRLQHGDTNWEAVNVRASTETVTDTGVAGTAGTWVNLKVVYAAGGSATYYINGTLVATISTNKPTDATSLFPVVQIVKAAGTTTRVLSVDAMALDMASDIDLEQILA